MTRISAYFPSSVLLLSSILLKWISGSIPRVLSPGGGLLLGLDVEDFTIFIIMASSIFRRSIVGHGPKFCSILELLWYHYQHT